VEQTTSEEDALKNLQVESYCWKTCSTIAFSINFLFYTSPFSEHFTLYFWIESERARTWSLSLCTVIRSQDTRH